ncbi:hypothetical protein HDU89_001994 [Geranomyces variabilis]|nr:hypothetical protein HDU89_001994 [Geranomyces variabilis]
MDNSPSTIVTEQRTSLMGNAGATAEKPKKKKLQGVSVPLTILLLVGSTLIAAAICVPVAVLAFYGANQTVTNVVKVVRDNYAQIVVNQVLELGATQARIAQLGAAGVAHLRAINTIVDGVPHDFMQDKDVMFEYYQLWQASTALSIGWARTDGTDSLYLGLQGMSCYNATIEVVANCSFLNVLAVNYNNASLTIDSGIKPWIVDKPGERGIASQNRGPFQTLANRPNLASFADTVFPATPLFYGPHWFWLDDAHTARIGLFSFYWNQWKHFPLGTAGPGAPVGYFDIAVDAGLFSEQLEKITLTENSLVAIWGLDGGIIAISRLSALAASDSPSSYTAEKHPLPEISVPAANALRTYGSYANLPDNYDEASSTSNGNYFSNMVRIKQYGMDWIVLVSIAERDINEPIVQSRKKVLITSLCVAFGMLCFAAAASFIITIPLKKLTAIMKQATNMDFSALSTGYLDRKVPISELAEMQRVFSTMLERFAQAIQNNRDLNRPGNSIHSAVASTLPGTTKMGTASQIAAPGRQGSITATRPIP